MHKSPCRSTTASAWLGAETREIRNSDIAIREAKADYVSAIGSFLPRATVRAEAGSSRGRAIDPNTNSYTTDSFEEGTVRAGHDLIALRRLCTHQPGEVSTNQQRAQPVGATRVLQRTRLPRNRRLL